MEVGDVAKHNFGFFFKYLFDLSSLISRVKKKANQMQQ